MLQLKDGVDLRGLQPPLILGMIILDEYFRFKRVPTVITSVCDDASGRLPDSLHKVGLAFDVRLPDGVDLGRFKVDISELLGSQFDVVLERDHFHIEFDPKTQRAFSALAAS